MNEQEIWAPLDEFPGYSVSTWGRIMNSTYDNIKSLRVNQQGVAYVNFSVEGKNVARSVSTLVARTFLPTPDRIDFNTPIHLDGDRFNARSDNLMWRPRWFAVKYHSEQKKPSAFDSRGPVIGVESETVFETLRSCARRYGLLEARLFVAVENKQTVLGAPEAFEWYEEETELYFE